MKRSPAIPVSLVVALLAACSTTDMAHGPGHGPGHGRAMADACAAHQQARTPEERRTAAEAHIVQMHGSADAAHVERHLRMMDQRCGSAGVAPKPAT